ncbi:serine/threonine protein kinase [Methylotetracoccus oryzae]|uniref:serine/threonine protein kinase n=1 Tax=Methylotetracoccus oryzae TaxID=1919059 RepID=UPI00111B1CBE|nr:serine/threonine protein kinase [Methylotetracoccus oryzae]
MDAHPFSRLTPDCVLNALDSVGFHTDGRLLALNSYENRVYQVGLDEGDPVVAKFYRPERWSDEAILEEHRYTLELADAELPTVPPLGATNGTTLHRFEGFRFAVFPRQGGHAPELDAPGTLQRLGRLLGRIHAVGALRRFRHRPSLDIATFGEEAREYLLEQQALPADLSASYAQSAAMALDGVRRCYDRAGDVRLLRLHGDCHVGNILWTDDGPHFVDFDDIRSGPAVQDLWMLLSGDRITMTLQLGQVIAGYRDFFDFDPRELHLIEALRTLRMIHYACWLAQRWSDPAFPQAFPWFGTPRYWQERILELREQIAVLDEPPLVLAA